MKLAIHRDVLEDLRPIKEADPVAASRIATFLEELKGNSDALQTLLDHNYGANQADEYHVSRWLSAWEAGNHLWRLKLWDLAAQGVHYRIIYGYLPIPQAQFIVLGIPHRDFDYDVNHPISQRILATLQRLSDGTPRRR